MTPYPDWLSPGDNAWQLLAATLVGLMSIPGVAILYGGLVQRKWTVNTILMVFSGFSLVLIVWVLWGFKMAFGDPVRLGPGILESFIGRPGPVFGDAAEQGRAVIPLLHGAMPEFRFPQSALVYFHFAFAAITPVLFLGSVVGRMSFRAWLLFVPLWSTLVYTVNAFLLWGGGWWAQHGALDYSGGYVIHLAAGTSGFVAAAVIGPRLAHDRVHGAPNNLPMVAVGAGVLWLGWNGFNGGDMYFAGANAATAVLNTNLAAATALLTWLLLDMSFGPQRKPTFLGSVNGMITGLVAITPGAGYVDGVGAILTGLIASTLVWLSWNKAARLALFHRVDDALGVFHTHGVAGLTGGLLVGLFANPGIIVYHGSAGTDDVSFAGLFYGNPAQLLWQAGAAGTIIVWDALVTLLILKALGVVIRLRFQDEVLESGDLGAHEEEAYPPEPLVSRRARSMAGPSTRIPEATEPRRSGIQVRLVRNPDPGEAATAPYLLSIAGAGLHIRLGVRRQPQPEHAYTKEIYWTELFGRRLERGNLPSLQAVVDQILTEVLRDGDVPRYVLHLKDGTATEETLLPVFRRGQALHTMVRGRRVEARDLPDLCSAVADHVRSPQGMRDALDLTVFSVTPDDLSGVPPMCVFHHRQIQVPVFAQPTGRLRTEVAGRELEAAPGFEGVLALRREVASLLHESGRLYDPLDLTVAGLASQLWAIWARALEPAGEVRVRHPAQSVPSYRVGDNVIAALPGPTGEVTVWFGRDRFDLAARIEAGAGVSRPWSMRLPETLQA